MANFFRVFRVLAVFAVGVGASATQATAQEATAAAKSAPPSAAREGHERMLNLLREVDLSAKRTNRYLGTDVIEVLKAKLVSGAPALRGAERFQILGSLAVEELRLGRLDDSIQHHLEAMAEAELLLAGGERIPPRVLGDTHFQLGVTHMRQGEVFNCCNIRTPDSCILPIQGSGIHTDESGSRAAIEEFLKVLEIVKPDSLLALKARWALNITNMTLGTWPESVPEPYRIAPEVFAAEEAFPRFTEVAQAKSVADEGMAGGSVVEDLTGDGLLDLLVTDSDTGVDPKFYAQTADGGWEDRTVASGLAGLTGGLNMVQGDYDNDGDVDVYVLRGAWWRDQGHHPNSLIQNDGRGNFTDVTFSAGLGEYHYPTQAAAWGDYDNDGDLDLFVGNESEPESVCPSQLFQNQGDGTFKDVAKFAGVTNDRYAKGAVWGDFNEDGWADLYVTNMAGENRLYRNMGDGKFTDVAAASGVGNPISSFPCIAFDYDQDGHLDIWASSFGSPTSPPDVAIVAASYLGLPHKGEFPKLYKGDGKGNFVDMAEQSGLTLVTVPMGANCGDLDYDGYPDLYLATGYPFYEGLVPNVLYHNQGGKRFANVTTAANVGHLQKGHGVSMADIDEDGDQDLFVRMGGAYPGDGYGNVYFDNPGFGNHWLKVSLVGKKSNRFGVGAKIEVDITENGVARTVHCTAGTGGSFGCNPLRQELGLGKADGPVRVRVRWPTSGTVQVFEGVPLDRELRIEEFAGAVTVVPL
jgi:hypothetical protein